MVEPRSLLAGAVTAYILPKALEKIGEKLGEFALEKSEKTIQSLRAAVQRKLIDLGDNQVLILAETTPNEANIQALNTTLLKQIETDQEFAAYLQFLINQIQVQAPSLQVVLDEVRIRGNVDMGDVEQVSSGEVTQQIISRNLGVGGDFRVGNIKQEHGEHN